MLVDRPSPHRKRAASTAAATIQCISASKRTLGLAYLPQCIACPLSGCMPTKSMQDPVELARVHAEVDKLGGRTPTCG